MAARRMSGWLGLSEMWGWTHTRLAAGTKIVQSSPYTRLAEANEADNDHLEET